MSSFIAEKLDRFSRCADTFDMGRRATPSKGSSRVMAFVRQQIERGGERLWRLDDFRNLPFEAVAQALSRLTRQGRLERLSKGVYYSTRQTAFGKSRPNPAAIQKLASRRKGVFPAGIAAANLLGFTTQTPRRSEISTSALSLPRKLVGSDTVIHTRRPEAWASLSESDAALLDFLRRAGRTSELSPEETVRRTVKLLSEKGRFERQLRAAASEPPRVRAMIGAIGEQLGKNLRDAVGAHPALTFVAAESQTIGGFGRNDRFSYTQRFGGTGEVANRVLLEAGTASGREPTSVVELRSYLGQFLEETRTSLGADDEGRFPLRLLHFRRTFVEKMFAIHGKVELLKRDKTPLGTYARHYYDLFQLAAQAEVIAMLKSSEYAAIKKDYDAISREYFARSYFYPEGMSYAKSDALFPPPELAKIISLEYEAQCEFLCYGSYPSWEENQAKFKEIRDLL